LDLSNNHISEIPSTLSLLQDTLHVIVLGGNPLWNVEEATMGTQALMNLLVNRQKEKKAFARYARFLLFVLL
jgi:hypothetical protein